jgi:fructose-1-phosphate kinase PfkB-like protein
LTAKGAEEFIKKGYYKFKSILKSKFGENHATMDAIQKLEEKPDSRGRQLMLSEEMVETGVDQDPDVLAAADELKSVVAQHVCVSVGSGAAAVGDNNIVVGKSGVYAGGDIHGDVNSGKK